MWPKVVTIAFTLFALGGGGLALFSFPNVSPMTKKIIAVVAALGFLASLPKTLESASEIKKMYTASDIPMYVNNVIQKKVSMTFTDNPKEHRLKWTLLSSCQSSRQFAQAERGKNIGFVCGNVVAVLWCVDSRKRKWAIGFERTDDTTEKDLLVYAQSWAEKNKYTSCSSLTAHRDTFTVNDGWGYPYWDSYTQN